MVHSCQDNSKTSNSTQHGSENGPSATSPSNSFIFRTTFRFRHIIMTSMTWHGTNGRKFTKDPVVRLPLASSGTIVFSAFRTLIVGVSEFEAVSTWEVVANSLPKALDL